MSIDLSRAQATKAGNILKTKDRKCQIFSAKAGNMLNISRLSEYFTMRNTGDKLFGQAMRGAWRIRLSLASVAFQGGVEPRALQGALRSGIG
jgi:hypothetical protein